MNILYIDHYAGSINMGMEFRPYYLANEWKKSGHRVRIVGASFSHLRTNNPNVTRDFEVQEIEGVEYQWIKTVEYHGNGIRRALTMFEFCFKLWINASSLIEEFKPNVVVTSSTYPLDTYPAQRIAKLAKAKLIHENHDLWPLTLETIGGMSKYHLFCLVMKLGLHSAIKNSEHIVCVLPYAYEYFKEYGLTNLDNFTHIPNGIVQSDWQQVEDLPEEHERLFQQLKEKFIVGYTGGHAISNALDTLIDCASQINDDRIAFVLVGKGMEKERLIAKSNSFGCKNIYFLPPVSKSQVPNIINHMDVVYVGGQKSLLLKYGASLNKLYDYMMSAKPIIYGVASKNKEVLDADCGWVIEPEDVSTLKKYILEISNIDSKLLRQKGMNGRKWVLANCDYQVLAEKFLKIFK